MESTAIASRLYKDVAQKSDGKRSHEIAEQTEKQAEALDAIASQQSMTATQSVMTTESPDVTTTIPLDQLKGVSTAPVAMTMTTTEQNVVSVLGQSGMQYVETSTLEQAADQLEEASKDLKSVRSVKMTENLHSKKAAAEAQLSVTDSTTFGITSTMDEEGLPDEERLKAFDVHEGFHEVQVAPDASAVQIGNTTVTATAFIEFGAISTQLDEVPASINILSTEYREEFYKNMKTFGIGESELVTMSQNGDFQAFGARAREILGETQEGDAEILHQAREEGVLEESVAGEQ